MLKKKTLNGTKVTKINIVHANARNNFEKAWKRKASKTNLR